MGSSVAPGILLSQTDEERYPNYFWFCLVAYLTPGYTKYNRPWYHHGQNTSRHKVPFFISCSQISTGWRSTGPTRNIGTSQNMAMNRLPYQCYEHLKVLPHQKDHIRIGADSPCKMFKQYENV